MMKQMLPAVVIAVTLALQASPEQRAVDYHSGEVAWRLHPGQWDSGKANPAFSDPKLTHIQFAAALASYLARQVRLTRRQFAEPIPSNLLARDDPEHTGVRSGEAGDPKPIGPCSRRGR